MIWWPRWARRRCNIFRVSLSIAAKASFPGERISIKYKLLSTSQANMLSQIRILWLMIYSLCKSSLCICPWEIRYTSAPGIYWNLFKIKTCEFSSRGLPVELMSPSPSADILTTRPIIRGWWVKAWKVENAERLLQMRWELAQSQIPTDHSFIELDQDVAIRYPSFWVIGKNEAWPEFSWESNAFVPMLSFWHLRIPAVIILPLLSYKTAANNLIRRRRDFSWPLSSVW